MCCEPVIKFLSLGKILAGLFCLTKIRIYYLYFMAKSVKKKPVKKERSEHYEQKVSFDGTFEQMIAISVKDADKKVKDKKETKK